MKYMAIVAAMFAVACAAGCAGVVGSENCQTNMAMFGCGDVSVDAQSPDGSINDPDAGNNNEVTGNETGDTITNPDSNADVASGDACEVADPCAQFQSLVGKKLVCGIWGHKCTIASLEAVGCECEADFFSELLGHMNINLSSGSSFVPPPPSEMEYMEYMDGEESVKCIPDPDYR